MALVIALFVADFAGFYHSGAGASLPGKQLPVNVDDYS
jgi:hypothetical protein